MADVEALWEKALIRKAIWVGYTALIFLIVFAVIFAQLKGYADFLAIDRDGGDKLGWMMVGIVMVLHIVFRVIEHIARRRWEEENKDVHDVQR